MVTKWSIGCLLCASILLCALQGQGEEGSASESTKTETSRLEIKPLEFKDKKRNISQPRKHPKKHPSESKGEIPHPAKMDHPKRALAPEEPKESKRTKSALDQTKDKH